MNCPAKVGELQRLLRHARTPDLAWSRGELHHGHMCPGLPAMACDAGAMTGPIRPDHAGRAVARRAALPAGAGLMLAFPVATWWLVGDLSTVPASADPDIAFRPFDIGTATARAAGVAAVALATVTLTVLVPDDPAGARCPLVVGAGSAAGGWPHHRGWVAGPDV